MELSEDLGLLRDRSVRTKDVLLRPEPNVTNQVTIRLIHHDFWLRLRLRGLAFDQGLVVNLLEHLVNLLFDLSYPHFIFALIDHFAETFFHRLILPLLFDFDLAFIDLIRLAHVGPICVHSNESLSQVCCSFRISFHQHLTRSDSIKGVPDLRFCQATPTEHFLLRYGLLAVVIDLFRSLRLQLRL